MSDETMRHANKRGEACDACWVEMKQHRDAGVAAAAIYDSIYRRNHGRDSRD